MVVLVTVKLLTDDDEPGLADERRVGGDHACVEALVGELRELDLQLPVVGLLVEDLEARVVRVGRKAEGQQVRVVAGPLQPGDL